MLYRLFPRRFLSPKNVGVFLRLLLAEPIAYNLPLLLAGELTNRSKKFVLSGL
jgi:hypothetical protein